MKYLSIQITIIISRETLLLMFKKKCLFAKIKYSLYYLHTILEVLENNNINGKKIKYKIFYFFFLFVTKIDLPQRLRLLKLYIIIN